jgi:hypothetical protein
MLWGWEHPKWIFHPSILTCEGGKGIEVTCLVARHVVFHRFSLKIENHPSCEEECSFPYNTYPTFFRRIKGKEKKKCFSWFGHVVHGVRRWRRIRSSELGLCLLSLSLSRRTPNVSRSEQDRFWPERIKASYK